MIVIEPSLRLVDALSGWGLRELSCGKYPMIQLPAWDDEQALLGVEVLLRHVPEIIARLLLAGPLDPASPSGGFKAALDVLDVEGMLVYDGRRHADLNLNEDRVRQLIETPDDIPIVCTVPVDKTERIAGPFILYDGWHRSRAWRIRAANGHSEPLIAHVIKTRRPLVVLDEAQATKPKVGA